MTSLFTSIFVLYNRPMMLHNDIGPSRSSSEAWQSDLGVSLLDIYISYKYLYTYSSFNVFVKCPPPSPMKLFVKSPLRFPAPRFATNLPVED